MGSIRKRPYKKILFMAIALLLIVSTALICVLNMSTPAYADTNVVLVVSGKAGQKIVIPGLPVGTTFAVEEVNLPAGWTLTQISPASGTISANGTSTVTVQNEYHTEGHASVLAHKRLDGGTLQAGQFAFQLLDDEDNLVSAASNGSLDAVESFVDDEGVSTANPWFGTAPILFGDMSFTQEGVYTYKIIETAGSDDTILYDDHEETVTITATDNGDGTMNCTVTYDADGAIFTNAVKPSNGTLKIQNITENATKLAADQEFQFTITLTDASGNPLDGTYDYKTSAVGEEPTGEVAGQIGNGSVVTLKGGEAINIIGLPVGVIYSVTEAPVEGWELLSSSGTNGSITNDGAVATFTNSYSTHGQSQIVAHKTYTNGTIPENYFKFEIRDSAGTLLGTTFAKSDGSVTFDMIDYKAADDGREFFYYINEVKPEVADGIEYDRSTKEVKVAVNDNGHGQMTAQITYDTNGMEFVNVDLTELTIKERIQGNGNRYEQFDFTLELTNADDTPYTDELPEPKGAIRWNSEGNGVYTFKLSNDYTITISLPDGVKYKITQDPKAFYHAVEIHRGLFPVINEAESPVAQGSIDADDGNLEVIFINSMHIVVPTGLTISMTGGLIMMAIAVGWIVLRRKRRAVAEV